MRWNGETPLPKPVELESGKNIKLPSRDKGREIPCRVFQPENGKPKGTVSIQSTPKPNRQTDHIPMAIQASSTTSTTAAGSCNPSSTKTSC